MDIIKLDTADSTNSWVAAYEKDLPSPALVYCVEQTAGRGQRGNSWESAPGLNITASLLFHPQDFLAEWQFLISENIALAIISFLKDLGVEAKVKWPNDIYVGDRKICGILVEHVVTGKFITRTIAGFGININQTEFLSDAPNPVSLSMLTGEKYNLENALAKLSLHLEKFLREIHQGISSHILFMKMLWRNDGNFYKFVDRKKDEPIEACIQEVAPTGMLTLQTREGDIRDFAFKEVEFVL